MENVPATTNSPGMMPLPTTPLGAMQANVSRQPIMKQVMFLVAIAASIAIGGYVLMWSQTPNYQVLFSGMQPKESSEVVAILQQSNIDYKLDPTTGALLVPASEVQALRMKLAAEGLPRSSMQGMEMLDGDQGFGTSQFVERARYQRAMEEELSRSISQLNNVQSARVHLATPKQSVFVRDRKEPTASVILNLYAGRNIEPGQVTAITHMVASSVPNMSNTDVTVVDQRGRLLSKNDRDANVALSDTQLEYTQKLEKGYIRRIEDILSPIVGMDGVRAQVVAEVDFTVTEQTQESYNPDLAAVRSEQIQEEKRVGAGGASGVPGALTNQPPGGGVAPETAANLDGQATSTVPGSSSKNSTTNYELDRTISHTRVAPGAVRKLSVAVLIDERHSLDTEGNVITTALTEPEMTRINALVMDAIGFNQARGDSLNVVNAPFIVPAIVAALPDLPIWEQTWVWDIAKQVLGGLLVLFLIFGVIRPAFKDLNKIPVADNKQGPDVNSQGTPSTQQRAASGSTGDDIAKITTGSADMEEQLSNVRSLVQQDPALVAQVVKNWSASDA
ncbi:MAG: flagellar M-ring protein FliF [Pseudomonadota bacterium]|nr:flagellar M-ring protein FliF [Pseudomonadota bacterium]MDO7711185.1 flagellar M-ring protein FliF [Pseudomonadota bacterium]